MAQNKAKFNKFMTGAVTATMVATAIVPVASAAAFTDIDGLDAKVKAEVGKAVDLGFFKDGEKFNPATQINRGQAALTLARYIAGSNDLKAYAEKEGLEASVTAFKDVPASFKDGEDYQAELFYASLIVKKAGAFTQENLNATGKMTRSQMAKVIVSTFGLTKDANYESKITDIAHLDAATKGFIETLAANEVTNVTTFNPAGNVTRSQMASFLVRSYDVVNPVGVEGIVSVKAINDTTVEVNFGKAIDSDFIREAELSGKYFAIYTEGETVQGTSFQSTSINFSADGKTARFTLATEIESGKKYHVALLDGDNKVAADVKYSFGPTELKAAATAPEFEVSAVADKIFVKYNAKMKDTAKDVANYEVFDEGGQSLGDLEDFLAPSSTGSWTNLNDKKEVEFQLATNSTNHLLAGKTYKIVVDAAVKTDDNKTLAENKRTIKVTTPSIDKASPTAKVARVVNPTTLEIVFDQDISQIGAAVQLNPAQLDLRTSTGKTVDVKGFDSLTVVGNTLTIELDSASGTLEKGTSYKVNMPANIVQNGIFTNATNKATNDLTAKAQDNVAIKTMKAQIVASAKNDERADLILTFDQVPVLDNDLAENIVIVDGKKEFKLQGATASDLKVFGGDTTGKSIIVEDIAKFSKDGAGTEMIYPQASKSYTIEVAAGKATTDSFDSTKVKNASKLKATTAGISVSKPEVDEVRIQSAEKIEIEFKEEIKGNFDPKDLEIDAFVANRSDIFDDATAKTVSGAGYYDVKISGKVLTITAKQGVKFPTADADLALTLAKDAFTNASGKTANDIITEADFAADIVDNAAPVLLMAEKGGTDEEVTLTFTEDLVQEGTDLQIGSLFFTDKGENASVGTTATIANGNELTVTFKEDVTVSNTDLSIITVKYTKGNSYYLQDAKANKVVTQTLKGLAQ